MSDATLTGGRVNYYLAQVEHPQREDQQPYQAECEDIITALGMTFDEGCLFKALWRTAAARLGNGKPGQKAKYDAEKMVHYAGRILTQLQNAENDVVRQEADKPVYTGWIEWSGSCMAPVPGEVVVEVVLRNGSRLSGKARFRDWNQFGGAGDIVKYRIVS
jgi:hypothetical protein